MRRGDGQTTAVQGRTEDMDLPGGEDWPSQECTARGRRSVSTLELGGEEGELVPPGQRRLLQAPRACLTARLLLGIMHYGE